MTFAQAHTQASVCPRCGSESYTTLYSGEDRLYGTTEQIFHIIECCGCNLIRIDPMPRPEELSQFYPETYWWEADNGAVGRLSELYRKFVLADHIRFAAAAAVPSATAATPPASAKRNRLVMSSSHVRQAS